MARAVAEHPFEFCTETSLVELTGLKAQDLQELLTHIKSVPDSSIYFHTHHFLKQHQALSPEPPNDFAYWVSHVLNESRLGEQLWAIDTVQAGSLRVLRDKIVSTLETYLSEVQSRRSAPTGAAFHFMKSRSFVFKTPWRATTLEEFLAALHQISTSSLYHHVFEARMRLKRGNDLSLWLEKELGEPQLAGAIARLDPYTQTLEGLRERIVNLTQDRLARAEHVHVS